MKFTTAILSWVTITIALPALGQQANQPLEYIEATSPLPGGGVVASVYVPGRGGPIYRGGPATTTPVPSSPNRFAAVPSATVPAVPNAGQIVPSNPVMPAQVPPTLNQAIPTPVVPIPARDVTVAVPPKPASNYPVQPTSAQIPNLGVAPTWNRSLDRGGVSVTPPNYSPQATLRVSQNYTPGVAPPTYFVVQNDPPTTHGGSSIFGTPREYSDGQPIRNLLRFVFP